jgi:hypothetical protein
MLTGHVPGAWAGMNLLEVRNNIMSHPVAVLQLRAAAAMQRVMLSAEHFSAICGLVAITTHEV